MVLKTSFVLPLLAVSLLAACGDKDFCPDPLVERDDRCACPPELMETPDGLGCQLPDGGTVSFPDVDAGTRMDAGWEAGAATDGGQLDGGARDSGTDAGPDAGAAVDAGSALPDLVVACDVSTSVEGAGDEFEVSYTITNFGGGPTDAPFVLSLFGLSTDGDDVLLDETSIAAVVSPAESSAGTLLAIAHDAIRHGDNELRCVVDTDGTVGEADESNNDSVFELRARGLPDLRWPSVRVPSCRCRPSATRVEA